MSVLRKLLTSFRKKPEPVIVSHVHLDSEFMGNMMNVARRRTDVEQAAREAAEAAKTSPS